MSELTAQTRDAIARWLVEKRREAKLTQLDVAGRTGMDVKTVQRLEKCQRTPRLETLARYSAAVGATLRIVIRDGVVRVL